MAQKWIKLPHERDKKDYFFFSGRSGCSKKKNAFDVIFCFYEDLFDNRKRKLIDEEIKKAG